VPVEGAVELAPDVVEVARLPDLADLVARAGEGEALDGVLHGLILEHIHADQLYLGCNGVDAERGVTNANLPEAELKRRMLRAAARRIVVADGSKIGAVSVAHLCGASDPDLLLTGASADPDTVAALELAGLAVQMAP